VARRRWEYVLSVTFKVPCEPGGLREEKMILRTSDDPDKLDALRERLERLESRGSTLDVD
jgi:hypothetical protein